MAMVLNEDDPECTFDPDKSRAKDSSPGMKAWMACELTGKLGTKKGEDHPFGVGEKTIEKLEAHGIDSTFKLMGMFFAGAPSQNIMVGCNKFMQFLQNDCDINKTWSPSVVHSIAMKCFAGFNCHLSITEDMVVSSRANYEIVEEFKMKAKTGTLTGDIAIDLYGISAKTADNLADLEYKTTWQMFGMALMCEDAAELHENIIAMGITPSWAKTVVHLIVEALAEGVTLPWVG